MDPGAYLCTLITQIEQLQRTVHQREEQVADWVIRGAVHEENRELGMSAEEQRNLDRLVNNCVAEAERVEGLLREERSELERLERARAGLEEAGFEV